MSRQVMLSYFADELIDVGVPLMSITYEATGPPYLYMRVLVDLKFGVSEMPTACLVYAHELMCEIRETYIISAEALIYLLDCLRSTKFGSIRAAVSTSKTFKLVYRGSRVIAALV